MSKYRYDWNRVAWTVIKQALYGAAVYYAIEARWAAVVTFGVLYLWVLLAENSEVVE